MCLSARRPCRPRHLIWNWNERQGFWRPETEAEHQQFRCNHSDQFLFCFFFHLYWRLRAGNNGAGAPSLMFHAKYDGKNALCRIKSAISIHLRPKPLPNSGCILKSSDWGFAWPCDPPHTPHGPPQNIPPAVRFRVDSRKNHSTIYSGRLPWWRRLPLFKTMCSQQREAGAP